MAQLAIVGKGQTGVYTPEFSGSIYADYTVAITDSLNLMIGAELNHVDEFYLQPDLDKVELAEATDKIDVRLGLAAKDGQWELILFGRNITDEQTRGFGTDLPLIPGAHFAFVGSGKEWGGARQVKVLVSCPKETVNRQGTNHANSQNH